MWCSGAWFSDGLGTVRFIVGLSDLKGLFQPTWFHGNRLNQLPDNPFALFLKELFHSPFWGGSATQGSFHWWGAPWGWHGSSCYSQAQPACHVRLILLCEAQLQPPKAYWEVLPFRIWHCLSCGSQDSAAVSVPPQETKRTLAQTQNHLNSAAIGMAWAWIWPGQLELCHIVSGHK